MCTPVNVLMECDSAAKWQRQECCTQRGSLQHVKTANASCAALIPVCCSTRDDLSTCCAVTALQLPAYPSFIAVHNRP
jgi:hypothetical protein